MTNFFNNNALVGGYLLLSNWYKAMKIAGYRLFFQKVYIGLVSITGDFVNEFVIVTPYFSGYREEKTKVLVITNNYQNVLVEMKKKENSSKIEIERSNLNVTLKMSDIVTAKIFYPEVYVEFERLNRRSIV